MIPAPALPNAVSYAQDTSEERYHTGVDAFNGGGGRVTENGAARQGWLSPCWF